MFQAVTMPPLTRCPVFSCRTSIVYCLQRTPILRQSRLSSSRSCSSRIRGHMFRLAFSFTVSLLTPVVRILLVNASFGNLSRHSRQSSPTVLPCPHANRNLYCSCHGWRALHLLLLSLFISPRFGHCILISVYPILPTMRIAFGV